MEDFYFKEILLPGDVMDQFYYEDGLYHDGIYCVSSITFESVCKTVNNIATERHEAASERALAIDGSSFRSIQVILKAGFDNRPPVETSQQTPEK